MSALAEWPAVQQYPTDESELKLSRFDSDIKRIAHLVAYTASRYSIDPEDLAQEAWLDLLKVNIAGRSEAYVRSVIFNATREARRAEMRFLSRHEPENGLEKEHHNHSPAPSRDILAIIAVQEFIESLPIALQQVYDALYVRNCDQRTAGAEMGVSQARVAQLHAELLKRGWAHFRVAVN